MKDKKFANISTEELQKKQKTIKLITGMLAGSLSILFFLTLYITITKEFTSLMIIPIALLPILLLNLNNISEINKVLKSRNV